MEANTAAILAEQAAPPQDGFPTQRPRERRFGLRPVSVRRARSFVVDGLSGWLSEERLVDLNVCVSELATNALKYSSGRGNGFRVQVMRRAEWLRVEVRDGGSSDGKTPHVRRPADDDSAGRGLLLVAALADDWGVRRDAGSGYTVWVEFRTSDPATPVTPLKRTEP
ncbi:ATP-binding protein [Streptomyces sp. NPDC046939]|uniref:ATP-binding protein n=1 Tax=Streptomyces sp. NPDC046939 TaxID=3155376 RepID=UPI00340EBF6B